MKILLAIALFYIAMPASGQEMRWRFTSDSTRIRTIKSVTDTTKIQLGIVYRKEAFRSYYNAESKNGLLSGYEVIFYEPKQSKADNRRMK